VKQILQRLILSARHLQLLDEFFRENYPLYSDIAKKMENVPKYDELLQEIYVGGKKRGKYGYGRQMILGDLFQYIFTGRGYYFAVKGEEYMESFVRILMYACNLLILMEDTSADADLRKRMLEKLENEIGNGFLEEEQREIFQKLKEYDGVIVGKEGSQFENIFDSLLPKRVGCVPELLVYCYLIRKNYGYVVPLLLSQRLLGNRQSIVPPDFLLLRSKGETFGLEVGTHKERQIASFSTLTSIPVFTVGIGSPEEPQPYRCGKCRKWIIYCDKVIETCAKNLDKPGQEFIDCSKCENFGNPLTGEKYCPYIVYFGKAHDYAGNIRELRYHYSCVKDDEVVQEKLRRAQKPKLIAPLPVVYGLEAIKEES